MLRASLGPGESEAISLALEAHADLLIVDDRPARRLAQALGTPIIGTLGVLFAAKWIVPAGYARGRIPLPSSASCRERLQSSAT